MKVDRLVQLRKDGEGLTGSALARFIKKQVVPVVQELVATGEVWWMDEATQKMARDMIKLGSVTLPNRSFIDCNGDHVPSRAELEDENKHTISIGSVVVYV